MVRAPLRYPRSASMPSDLVERLLRPRPPGATAARDRAALERLLHERLASARAAWPGVDVDDGRFIDALAARSGGGEPAAEVAALCTDDLYLALACGAGDAHAIAAFERRYAGELAAAFRSFVAHGSGGDDLRQVLRERLFVGQAGKPPRIAEFTGRGSLRAWLKIAAVRLRIDRERRKGDRPANFVDDDDALDRLGDAADDPELLLLKTHYREHFKAAFVAALAELDPKDRAMLRLNAVEGLSATDLARIHNVHRATTKRWLADARERLIAATQRRLVEQIGDRGIGLASIVRLIRSDLDLSLARHLA